MGQDAGSVRERVRRVIERRSEDIERRWLARVQQDIVKQPGVELTLLRDGMPDYLRLPFAALTVVFGLTAVALTGRTFHALPHERRWRVVEAWRRLPVSFARDLLRFYEGLVVFAWFTLEHGGELG